MENVIANYISCINTNGSKEDHVFLEVDGNKIHSEINLKSGKPDVKIFFPRFDEAFAEVIIKRTGGENILAFSNQIINRLPVLKLGNSAIQSFTLDLMKFHLATIILRSVNSMIPVNI